MAKILGLIFGIMAALFAAGTIAGLGSHVGIGSQSNSVPILIGGGMVGFLVVAFPAWVLGVMISSQGQLMKASLDGAVHSSPFLNNSQKAEVMSLK